MENLYGVIDSKHSKRSSLSPVHNFATPNPYYHYKIPVIDHQYPSPDSRTTSITNPNSPFLRYLQSPRSSPSSIGDHQPSIGYKYNRGSVSRSSQNSPRQEPLIRSRSPLLFKNTAVKGEEDVLVMDGVVVKNPAVDRVRSPSSSLTGSGASSSSPSPSPSPSPSSSLSSPGVKNYKLDLCVSYKNFGYCHFGTNCQYVHGNKELRASQFPYKTTYETPCKNYSMTARCVSPATPTNQNVTPVKVEEVTRNIASLKTTDWSPLDDDIDMGDNVAKEDIDALFEEFFNGPKKSKRLPVFIEICPE